jgi:hypothetical protein
VTTIGERADTCSSSDRLPFATRSSSITPRMTDVSSRQRVQAGLRRERRRSAALCLV